MPHEVRQPEAAYFNDLLCGTPASIGLLAQQNSARQETTDEQPNKRAKVKPKKVRVAEPVQIEAVSESVQGHLDAPERQSDSDERNRNQPTCENRAHKHF